MKAISLNNTTSVHRNGRRSNSKQYNMFRKEAFKVLNKQKEKICNFIKDFNPKIHTFEISYVYGMVNLIKKDGTGISKKSKDVDNLIKPINDVIFKCFEAYNTTIDDSLVHKVTSRKIISDIDEIHVKINILGWKEAVYNKVTPQQSSAASSDCGTLIYDTNTL